MRDQRLQTIAAMSLSAVISAFAGWCFHGEFRTDFTITGIVAAFVVNGLIERMMSRLRARNRKLEAEVALRNAEIGAARIAASIAHEIKNPLGAVIGNLELCDEILACTPLDTLELARAVRAATAAARHADNLVADLSVLGHATDDARPAELSQAATTAARIARTRLGTAGRFEIDLDRLPRVAANESRMVQVLSNLMINAALATRPGVANVVSVSGRVEGDHVHLSVADLGAGISPENLARVFETGFTTRGGRGGTGLGLPIVRRILEDAGGGIRVESTEGQGTQVHFWVPMTKEFNPPI